MMRIAMMMMMMMMMIMMLIMMMKAIMKHLILTIRGKEKIPLADQTPSFVMPLTPTYLIFMCLGTTMLARCLACTLFKAGNTSEQPQI